MNYMYRNNPNCAEPDDGFRTLLNELEPGDCMVVQQFSGAANSARGFLDAMLALDAKGVSFRSIQEKFDTRTEQGQITLGILKQIAALGCTESPKKADPEPKAAEETAEEAKTKGRKPIEVDNDIFNRILEQWQKGEITAKEAMNALNLKPNTFYRRVKEKMTDTKTGEALFNAAAKLGKDIAENLQAEAEQLAQDCSDGTFSENLEKNINAAGSVLNSLGHELQSALEQIGQTYAPKNEEKTTPPADAPVDAHWEVTEDNEEN